LWTMELHRWLCWTSEGGNAPMFVRTVAEAARMACSPNYVLLRSVLLELKRRYLVSLGKSQEPEKLRRGFGMFGVCCCAEAKSDLGVASRNYAHY
jgi:hypothetical protein